MKTKTKCGIAWYLKKIYTKIYIFHRINLSPVWLNLYSSGEHGTHK